MGTDDELKRRLSAGHLDDYLDVALCPQDEPTRQRRVSSHLLAFCSKQLADIVKIREHDKAVAVDLTPEALDAFVEFVLTRNLRKCGGSDLVSIYRFSEKYDVLGRHTAILDMLRKQRVVDQFSDASALYQAAAQDDLYNIQKFRRELLELMAAANQFVVDEWRKTWPRISPVDADAFVKSIWNAAVRPSYQMQAFLQAVQQAFAHMVTSL